MADFIRADEGGLRSNQSIAVTRLVLGGEVALGIVDTVLPVFCTVVRGLNVISDVWCCSASPALYNHCSFIIVKAKGARNHAFVNPASHRYTCSFFLFVSRLETALHYSK